MRRIRSLLAPGRRLARFLPDAFRRIDTDGAGERGALGGRYDPRPLVVFSTVAVVLLAIHHAGETDTLSALLAGAAPARWRLLAHHAGHLGAIAAGYLLVPLVVMRLLAVRAVEWGFGLGRLREHARAYVVLYLGLLPFLALASRTDAFTSTYPLYPRASRSWADLLAWESIYGASFIAVEAFFRGFMLLPLRRSLGSSAIFAMAIPYCVIHFHKPLPEAVGAILAAIVLGTLAMESRSIWGGVALHVAVAWTMDLFSLIRKGSGIAGFWPSSE